MVKYPEQKVRLGKTTRSWRRDRPRQRSFLMSFLSEGLAPEDDLMEEDFKVDEAVRPRLKKMSQKLALVSEGGNRSLQTRIF